VRLTEVLLRRGQQAIEDLLLGLRKQAALVEDWPAFALGGGPTRHIDRTDFSHHEGG